MGVLQVMLGILLFEALIQCGAFVSGNDNIGYVFTFAKNMIEGRKNRACLVSQNATYPLDLSVTFKDNRKTDHFKIDEGNACFDLNVPQIKSGKEMEADFLTIELNGNKEKPTYERVNIYKLERVVRQLEMDRDDYEIGDKISMRILSVDQELKPRDNAPFNVTIHDEEHSTVTTWSEVQTNTGLTHLYYQLQDTDKPGIWHVVVNKGEVEKHFEVRPRNVINPNHFRVITDFPSDVYFDDKVVRAGVCAKYPNGKGLDGEAQFVITSFMPLDDNGSWTRKGVVNSDKLKDGCVSFDVPFEDLGLERTPNDEHRDIDIVVNITEPGSDRKIYIHAITHMTIAPCTIAFEMLNPHTRINPGLPYIGQVDLTKKRANLEGMTLQLCYKRALNEHNYDDSPDPEACLDIIIGSTDAYNYTVPPLQTISEGIVLIKASIKEAPGHNSYLTLFPIHSDSHNSIHITPIIPKDSQDCKSKLEFKIAYTLNTIKSGPTGFHFMLISPLGLVKRQWIPYVSDNKRSFDPLDYTNTITGNSSVLDTESQFNEISYFMNIDDVDVNDYSVLVYYIVNGEVIADTVPLDISKCLRNTPKITWVENPVSPGQKATLKILTTKGSVCSVKATSGTLTSKKDLSEVQVPHFACPLHVDATEFTGVNSSAVPKYGLAYMPDASFLFLKSDLGIITNQKLRTSPCNLFPSPTEAIARKKRDVQSEEPKILSTFLWDMIPATDDLITLDRESPNKTGSWVTRALCVSKEHGLTGSEFIVLNVI